MSVVLQTLLKLQEHDTAISHLQRRMGALPERVAAHDLNERRHALETSLTALASQLVALSTSEEEVEKELATVEDRANSLDAALRSPGSANRDAQAIIHEVDQLRAQAGEIEMRGLELLEQRDGLLDEQKAAQADLEAVAGEAPAVLSALRHAESDAAAELSKLQNERASAAAGIDATLLATYDKLRTRLDGVAVAQVVSGSCTGCHLSLPAVDLERLAKLASGQYTSCEQCGRILIPS